MPSWRGEETLFSFYFLSSKITCSSLRMIWQFLLLKKPPFSFFFIIPATEKWKTWLVLIIAYRTSGVVVCYLPLESVFTSLTVFHTVLAWTQCHAVDSANYRSPPSACICFKLNWINMSVPLYKQHTVIFSWFVRNKGQEECLLSLFVSRLFPVLSEYVLKFR
jgi:hypothetical protein